jgi:hypothetical protein
MSTCNFCHTQLRAHQTKYCSNACQAEYTYAEYIRLWKLGLKSGKRGIRTLNFSAHVVRYMLESSGSACVQCGWNETHSITQLVPLEIDHIDGDAYNTVESNLRLLCPNCHSLTPTYKNLNKGFGRVSRMK